jgi:hypothetical protein
MPSLGDSITKSSIQLTKIGGEKLVLEEIGADRRYRNDSLTKGGLVTESMHQDTFASLDSQTSHNLPSKFKSLNNNNNPHHSSSQKSLSLLRQDDLLRKAALYDNKASPQ